MSVKEMKLQLERMSADKRSELESFLRAKRAVERPDFPAKVAAAQKRMDEGQVVTATELRALLHASPLARD